jgi:hypothetical protein
MWTTTGGRSPRSATSSPPRPNQPPFSTALRARELHFAH